nr:transposase domain-containing protein [uncultured Eisenbergiella sp.]
MSNNLCETNIKPYATERRFDICRSPRGARANAILYTLVESARANKLDGYEYLKYLLTEMPNNSHLEHLGVIDRYLPWSKEWPEERRLEHKHKKHFEK